MGKEAEGERALHEKIQQWKQVGPKWAGADEMMERVDGNTG